jgi:hypothetical protein
MHKASETFGPFCAGWDMNSVYARVFSFCREHLCVKCVSKPSSEDQAVELMSWISIVDKNSGSWR